MAFNREAALKAGYTPQEIDDYLASKGQNTNVTSNTPSQPQSSTTQKIGGFLSKIGLGFIPQIGESIAQTALTALPGGAGDYGSPEQQARAKMNGGVFLNNEQLNRASNPKTAAVDVGKNIAGLVPYALPFIKVGMLGKAGLGATSGALHNISQPDTSAGGIAQEAAIGAIAVPIVSTLGKLLKTPAAIASNPTKNIAANKTTQAAEQASQKGVTTNWEDLSSKIRDAIKTKFGERPDITQATNSLLSEKTPGQIANTIPADIANKVPTQYVTQTEKMTPTQLLDWRRQIASRGGQGFFERFFKGQDITTKVEGEARNVISKELHNLVPKTITPDKAYSIYAKQGFLGGDVPAWIRNIVLEEVARRTLGSVLSKSNTGQILNVATGGL